jgi:hypothetical protein
MPVGCLVLLAGKSCPVSLLHMHQSMSMSEVHRAHSLLTARSGTFRLARTCQNIPALCPI